MPDLFTDVQYIKGIGKRRALTLNKLGIFTLFDLLSHFPRDYEDRTKLKIISELEPDETACVRAIVSGDVRQTRIRKGLEISKVQAIDDSGVINLTFFNQNYIKDSLKIGKDYIFYGKISKGQGKTLEMQNPVFEYEDKIGTQTVAIVPIYKLSEGISRNVMSASVKYGLDAVGDSLPEFLPDIIRDKYKLAHIRYAYDNIHFPQSFENLELARRRLIFEELFVLSLGLFSLKNKQNRTVSLGFKVLNIEKYYDTVGFELTDAQKRCIAEAISDMTSGFSMNRLIQGDVGSGKTAVAAACCFFTYLNGAQSAFMAPTEILAEQHFDTLEPMLKACGMKTALLTGSVKTPERQRIKTALSTGEIDLIIGTHALISDGIEFKKLGLAVTDEQHRFGVRQRAALSAKGKNPHLLVMSATPIPRTLALIMYGDLDVSIIDKLPPGRRKIDTFLVGEDMRERINAFVRKLISQGRQVYIVCPAVDGGNIEDDRKAVEIYARQLQEKIFPELRISLVHGKLKPKEKDAAMRAFALGETDILVATTVIEVGINVPNAALMIIENADRFGLSQLHQLRGRVGRGEHKSYCIMFSETKSEETKTRLKAMCDTNDGFKISEQDLKLRGPGDFFGSRQHGMPKLKIADLYYDTRVLKEAQEAAADLIKIDPELKLPENTWLRTRIELLFKNTGAAN